MGRRTYSVLIAAYQAEDTISRAVRSALDQDVDDPQVIVCDDGSTDGTADELARFGSNITVIRQPNRGQAAARNAALAAADGTICALLDADDEWAPDRLAAIDERFDGPHPPDIVTTDAWIVEDGRRTGRWYDSVDLPHPDDQPTEILRENFVFGSAAVPRERLQATGGFSERLTHADEYEVWIRILLDGGRASVVPRPLATYHRSPGSLSLRDRRGTYRSVIAILERVEREFALTAEQRAALGAHRRRDQRWLDVLDAMYALAEDAEDVRDRCLRAAANSDLELTKRFLFTLAAALPRLASAAFVRIPRSLRPSAAPPRGDEP